MLRNHAVWCGTGAASSRVAGVEVPLKQDFSTRLVHPSAQKKSAWDGAPGRRRSKRLLGQGLDRLSEASLAARRRVLVHDLLVGDAIDHRLLGLQFLGRRGLVAGADRLSDFLDRGAQRRLEARVALPRCLGLPGTLARLGGIGHGTKSLLCWGLVES